MLEEAAMPVVETYVGPSQNHTLTEDNSHSKVLLEEVKQAGSRGTQCNATSMMDQNVRKQSQDKV